MTDLVKIRSIFLYKLDIQNMVPMELKIPVEIEKIDYENISKVLNFRDLDVINSFKSMLDNNQFGVFGIFDKKAIYHVWAIVNCSDSMKRIGDFFKTRSRIAYIHFGRVKEDLRGNNIGPYMVNNLIKLINETYNIEIFYIDTDESNIASQKSIIKSGFKLCHKYKFISIRGHIINKRIIR